MKAKKFQKKLSLNKITVTTMGKGQLNDVHGGRFDAIQEEQKLDTCGDSCLQSCYFVTCGN